MKINTYQYNLITKFIDTYWEDLETRHRLGVEINKFLKLKPIDDHQDIRVQYKDNEFILRAYYCEMVYRDVMWWSAYIRYMFEIQPLECL